MKSELLELRQLLDRISAMSVQRSDIPERDAGEPHYVNGNGRHESTHAASNGTTATMEHGDDAHEQSVQLDPEPTEDDVELTEVAAPERYIEDVPREAQQHEAESPDAGDHTDAEHQDNSTPVSRWWVTFNGSVSLERMARVRVRMLQSPFVIDARFEEIGDGLITMRVVTANNVSGSQLDWVLKQLLESNGLDPNCALLSRA